MQDKEDPTSILAFLGELSLFRRETSAPIQKNGKLFKAKLCNIFNIKVITELLHTLLFVSSTLCVRS